MNNPGFYSLAVVTATRVDLMNRMALAAVFVLLALMIQSCGVDSPEVRIRSWALRDRIALTDTVTMKKALFVAAEIRGLLKNEIPARIEGLIELEGKTLSVSNGWYHGELCSYLVFDLPHQIPDDVYRIRIRIHSDSPSQMTESVRDIARADMTPYMDGFASEGQPKAFVRNDTATEKPSFILSEDIVRDGFAVFSRPPHEFVLPETVPRNDELINRISLNAVRGEFEPACLTLYPIKPLGTVTVQIGELRSVGQRIPEKDVSIYHFKEVESRHGSPEGTFRKVPNRLSRAARVTAIERRCERFWLLLRIDESVIPGIYKGTVHIETQHGGSRTLPIAVSIAPLTITDVPDVDYFMLMTYEFFELNMPWSPGDKKKIYRSAVKVLQDYKNHGMTTVCLHSHFVPQLNRLGKPAMEDVYEALRAVNEVGFTRPVLWYMGHLLNTAKPRHPGNINCFEEEEGFSRLGSIVDTVAKYSDSKGYPEVIFLPIDEPDDRHQDPTGERGRIAPVLLDQIKFRNCKNAITSRNYYVNADLLLSSLLNENHLRRAHRANQRYILYDNSIPGNTPAYARYRYGYYIWQKGIDGMATWTFQTTQNARGLPGIADTAEKEVFLAYPDPAGPIATLQWEAVREGIDDRKLLHQLEMRVQSLSDRGCDTGRYDGFLNEAREMQFRKETFFPFQDLKLNVIRLILHADEMLESVADRSSCH